MKTRRCIGWLCLALLLLVACAKQPWTAPISQLAYGLEVVMKKAYVKGDDTLAVEATVVNKGDESVRIDRKYWALELPTGETLRHEGASSITIAPGGASDVNVSFGMEGEGFASIRSATLIVGGVFVGDDPSPYPAGEIPLSQGAVATASVPAPIASASAPEEAAPVEGPPAVAPKKGEEGPTMLSPEADD